ncbi:MAG: hypothetical protein KIPDCIKN_00952 [Haliscomenobacter sp.]|jgi:hypothetical protein|nr:hypothetical protein [Haliscomenobacter sp.]
MITLMCWQAQARVLHVKAGGFGDGTSWEAALGDLQRALSLALPGDEIWVSSGIYLPTAGSDRFASFVIPSGVKLLGGFAGNETAAIQRDFTLNRTVLSGEIGSPNTDTDNSYTVVITRLATPDTHIDGFVITGGNANNPIREIDPTSCGGGWFNDARNGASSPTISNCAFRMNKAYFGGAIYNNGSHGDCSGTRIQNCDFFQNDARVDGGAIYNQGSNGLCNLTVQSCNFEENQAHYGAGILNRADYGTTSPFIENCTFTRNGSFVRASGIYNHREQSGICNPVVKGCRFDDNNYEMVGDAIGGNTIFTTNPEDVKKSKKPIVIRPTTAY